MFRIGFRWSLFLCFLTVLWLFGACSGDGKNQEGSNTNDGGTTNTNDGGVDNNNNQPPEGRTPPGDGTGGKWLPSGMAAMEFSIDDSANKTYKEGQLFWNGSFVYEKDTNTVTFSSAWQPTDGPFPPLYDDGPIDKGGHEPVGSTAGDNIWGIVVFVKPDDAQDLEFEYGLINDNNHWLWEGSNGLIVVKKGATDVVKAKGLALPAHGSIDVKITLDLSKLQKDYAVDDPKNPPLIFLKGTMTNWAHVQVQDKGKRGDDKADDGILTFVQSQNLDYSTHFGLLQHKRHVQFVYQFTSIAGREYKDTDDNALPDGVTAWADCNGDGKFTDDEKQKIVMEKDSRGAVQNTTIVVCEGKEAPCGKADCSEARCKDKAICKGCTADSDCGSNETCDTASGKCQPKGGCTKADCGEARCKSDPVCKCSTNSDCKTDEVCNTQSGACEPDKKCSADSDCGKDQTCDKASGRCLSKVCTASDCNLDRCKSDPVCTSSGQSPVIYFVRPASGPTSGGTTVTISGERFKQGAKVEFGGIAATNVKFVSATELSCSTPAGGAGSVDVVVTNPDGKSNTFPQGFKYGGGSSGTKMVNWCKIQWPNKIPDTANNVPAAKVGQASPLIYGWVYMQGSTDKAGQGSGITAQVGYGPAGTNPSVDKNWKWFPATYLGDKAGPGNPTSNDEYKGAVTVGKAGTYDYAYRFTADGGTSYRYCNPGTGNDDKTPYETNKAPKITAQ